jgi:hypothetical protein
LTRQPPYVHRAVAIQGRHVNRFFAGKIDAKQAELLWTVVQIGAIWTVSDLGYYYLLPALGAQPSYNDGSIAVTLYYVFWIGIAVIAFWPVYASWPRHGRQETFENRLTSFLVWTLSFAGCLLFAAYMLPKLPSIDWTMPWRPPEMVVATPWYFLPKSIDILFQQLLILALVLALAARPYGIRTISLCCAVGFGAVHALLAFGDVPLGYVIRFMVSAAAFGFIFPYLLLRVPNGLAYSYIVHWVYYALSVVLPHIFLASSK